MGGVGAIYLAVSSLVLCGYPSASWKAPLCPMEGTAMPHGGQDTEMVDLVADTSARRCLCMDDGRIVNLSH